MKTTVEALRLLYVAFGGDADDVADVTLIPDMIEKIAAVVPAAMKAILPTVTTTDNGKALIVSSGKWAAATIPSQLPAVTAEDYGKVLKVDSSGEWAVGTDAIE